MFLYLSKENAPYLDGPEKIRPSLNPPPQVRTFFFNGVVYLVFVRICSNVYMYLCNEFEINSHKKVYYLLLFVYELI